MILEGSLPARQSAPTSAAKRSPRLPRWSLSAGVFAGTVAFVVVYALRDGAYDIVVRQEYGLVVWWVIGVGFALGVLPRSRPGWPVLAVIAALGLYAVWTAISLAWSSSSERTTAEIARVLAYIGVAVLIISVLDGSTWRAAARGLGFAALVVCGIAVVSRLIPGAFPRVAFSGTILGSRLSYPFGYWNAVGAWAAMSMAMGLAWSADEDGRTWRAVALGLVPVAGVAAYLSYSRAAVGGVVVAVLAAVLLSRNRITALVHVLVASAAVTLALVAVRHAPEIANGTGTRGVAGVVLALIVAVAVAAGGALATSAARLDRIRLSRRTYRAVIALCVGVLLIGGVVFAPGLASRAWRQFRHPATVAGPADPAARLTQLGGSRYYYWQAAIDAFRARPMTGTGAGTYEFWWNQHGANGEFIRNAHSLELENLAELGWPGLLLITSALLAAVAVLVRTRRDLRLTASAGAGAALLGAFLVYLVQASVDWMWQSTAVTVLALGVVAVASVQLARRRPSLRWYGRAAVAVVALCAGLVQIPGLLSTAEIRRSQTAERHRNGGLAYSWANAAVAAEPWAAGPYDQRALVLESGGRLGAAARDLQRAIAREPSNFTHWLLLARVETEQGQLAAASRALTQARRLRPKALVQAAGQG